jgi:hypothetical protein
MRQIGAKYHTEGDIYKYDGTLIPPGEPVILFRARDRLVPDVLDFYLALREKITSPKQNLSLLRADSDAIKAWQLSNPDKVRTPR